MWPFSRKGASGFSWSSTAEEVTEGLDGSGLTAVVTGLSDVTLRLLLPARRPRRGGVPDVVRFCCSRLAVGMVLCLDAKQVIGPAHYHPYQTEGSFVVIEFMVFN
ncbi:hypothetical protein BHE74_00008210 [Ensete ventricosum]|nr:hypothetical protein BHE74_00008210 [Ensete ventricosum]